MELTLTSTEAVPLAAASVLRVATNAEVRALMVKGEVLTQQGLRGAHASVDVDVLVDPSDGARYLGLLDELGWHPIAADTAASILGAHATTLQHEYWPISIDVHHRFPGFLADPQSVFDILWERHVMAQIAGVDVAVPDRITHAALTALHYLRDPASGRAVFGLPDLVERVGETFSDTDLVELATVASDTGSVQTLHTFLEAVEAPALGSGSSDPEALASWRLRTELGRATSRAVGIGRQPLRSWPAALWHAIMLDDEEIAIHHQAPGETLTQARWRRFRRGAHQFPKEVGGLLRLRIRQLRRRG